MTGTRTLFLDRLEAKYVGVYRWLLLLIGVFSFLGFVILAASLLWTTSSTQTEPSSEYFVEPNWQEIRRSVLPLRMKPEKGTQDDKPEATDREEIDVAVHPLVVKIRTNLLKPFEKHEIEMAEKYLPKRVLNEWLLEEVSIPSNWRETMLKDLVTASLLIGRDERIKRVASVDGRIKIVYEAFEAYVVDYTQRVGVAIATVERRMDEKEAEKARLTSQIFMLLPIVVAIFLSMIGLVLMIRMELHLRQLAKDYHKANA